jgi:hypothetical protein
MDRLKTQTVGKYHQTPKYSLKLCLSFIRDEVQEHVTVAECPQWH